MAMLKLYLLLNVFLATIHTRSNQQPRQLNASNIQKQSFDINTVFTILFIIYLGGLMLVVYEKSHIQTLEDILTLFQLNYYFQDKSSQIFNISPTLVYSILHGFSYTALFACCIYDKKTGLGLSTVISSDQFNLLIVYQLIVCQTSQQVDQWLFLRDNIYYSLGLIMIIIFQFLQYFDLSTGFLMIAYFLFYKFILGKNNQLKYYIFRCIGKTSKDQDFDSSKHFQFKMRRYSITDLVSNKCIKAKDRQRDYRISKFSSKVTYSCVKYNKNYKLYSDLYRMVMKVIYGIRQHIKNQKKRRYDQVEQTIILNGQDAYEKKKKQYPYCQNSQDEINDMIIDKNDKTCYLNTKVYQITNGQDNQLENIQDNQIDNDLYKNSYDNDDFILTIDEVKEINKKHYSSLFTIEFPKNETFFKKILWIIYSPFIIIFELVPSYKENISQKYLFINFFMSLVLIFSIVVTIYATINRETQRLKMEIDVWGNNLLGIIFSIPFMKYNMKAAQVNKQSDFLHSFILLSVYKMGMIVGISWMIMNQIYTPQQLKNSNLFDTRSGINISVTLGLHLIAYIFIALITKFKIDRTTAKVCISIFIIQYIVQLFILIQ